MKGAVSLNGDGLCDSPGHNAKCVTYTLMDDNTGKITAFSIVQGQRGNIVQCLWRRKGSLGASQHLRTMK